MEAYVCVYVCFVCLMVYCLLCWGLNYQHCFVVETEIYGWMAKKGCMISGHYSSFHFHPFHSSIPLHIVTKPLNPTFMPTKNYNTQFRCCCCSNYIDCEHLFLSLVTDRNHYKVSDLFHIDCTGNWCEVYRINRSSHPSN